ncbi:MAG: leucine-rich repeat domain-containing protein [Bacteroidales bacterium]|nr:leucine-rich repeat domain-containing protein [Bacteroidales bacterium]
MIIRRTLIFICTILCANVLLAQDFYENGVGYTINGNTVAVTGYVEATLPADVVIPSTVTNDNTTYTVTKIGASAFYKNWGGGVQILSVTIPSSVEIIDGYAFRECCALSTVTIEKGSVLNKIGMYAFYKCNNLISFTILAETAPTLSYDVFSNTPGTKELTVPFGSNYPSNWGNTNWSKINHKINAEETKTLNYTFLMTTANKREVSNEGVIKIEQGGEIVNATENNVGGIIEVVTPQKSAENWNFCGAPFEDYKLEVVKPVENSDVAVCTYNYGNGAWNNHWATIDTAMKAGESAFAYHFYTGPITFTTYGDLGTLTTYPPSATAKYYLNNSDVTVSNSIVLSENGYWMPLANPYPAKLSVSKFLQNPNNVQGQGVYVWNGTSFDLKQDGDIKVTEGFFVNYSSAGSHTATFKKTQLTNYPTTAKSEVAPREFIELALEKGEESVKVYFAHNEDAEQEYDIYDANKMFATMGAAEPYFLTDGIALIKEEVKTLPYYATMNVRSEDDTVMNFVIKNLPDRYAVSIIDGDNVIDMTEGSVYSTEIARGDNENRFKLLVKQGVGLTDVEELNVRITNSNRHVTVQTAEINLNIEVYNTLGQKVFSTKQSNFILKGVPAGAYMIKVYNNKASKTAKIVIQ